MHALQIQAPQQTLSASAGQWGHHRGHSTTCLDCRPCNSTITWAPDHAPQTLRRCSADTHPHSRRWLCGRSVGVDASNTHATATSSVCEPFLCTEGVSATNFPRGLGGRKRDQENLSMCHQQVQQSFCTALAFEDFCSLYQY